MLRQLKVATGDRVAVQVDKSAEAVCLYLACLKIGAVYLPINTAFTRPEADYILTDAKPTAYVGRTAASAEAGGGVAPAVLDLDEAAVGAWRRELD